MDGYLYNNVVMKTEYLPMKSEYFANSTRAKMENTFFNHSSIATNII